MIINSKLQAAIIEKFRKAERRLILLDYDGTLVEYKPKPEQAIPPESLLEILKRLAGAEGNEVIIISGRDHSDIDLLLGQLPIDIIAGHGAIIKEKGEWRKQVSDQVTWKEIIRPIMDQICLKCSESFVEDKHFSLAWHYRNATRTEGYGCSRELISQTSKYFEQFNLKALDGNMVVEIMDRKIGKGIAVKNLMATRNNDFILSIGDDVTDEEVFEFLRHDADAVTIKVGSGSSVAGYSFNSVGEVVLFLNLLSG